MTELQANKPEEMEVTQSELVNGAIPEAPPIPSKFPKRLASPSPPPLAIMEEYDPLKVPYHIRDKVKQKFKNYFGGRERMIAVGGAAVPKELKRFLQFCFDAIVSEGYGTTEVRGLKKSINYSIISSGTSDSRPSKYRTQYTLQRKLPNVHFPIVLIHFLLPKRGQLPYKGQNGPICTSLIILSQSSIVF